MNNKSKNKEKELDWWAEQIKEFPPVPDGLAYWTTFRQKIVVVPTWLMLKFFIVPILSFRNYIQDRNDYTHWHNRHHNHEIWLKKYLEKCKVQRDKEKEWESFRRGQKK